VAAREAFEIDQLGGTVVSKTRYLPAGPIQIPEYRGSDRCRPHQIDLIIGTELDRARKDILDQINAVLREPYTEIRPQDE
jgi:hypothetical protein